MQCSSCGLENLPTARQCDCGAPLGGGVQQFTASAHLSPLPPPLPAAGLVPHGVTMQYAPHVVQVPYSAVQPWNAIRLVWLLPMFGALVAGADFAVSWGAQKSAPQQAALAGFALACVVIPYCFARALMELTGKD